MDTSPVWAGGKPIRPKPPLRSPGATRPIVSVREENDDVLNERLYLENRDRPLHQVQEDFHQAYQTFLKQVQAAFRALSDQDLNDPYRFPELEGHTLSAFIAGNSYDHYREHAEQIQRWLGNEQG